MSVLMKQYLHRALGLGEARVGPFVIEVTPKNYLKSQTGEKNVKFITTHSQRDAMQFPLRQNAENHMKQYRIPGEIIDMQDNDDYAMPDDDQIVDTLADQVHDYVKHHLETEIDRFAHEAIRKLNVRPGTEIRRDYDGVSEVVYMIKKMVGETLSDGKPKY